MIMPIKNRFNSSSRCDNHSLSITGFTLIEVIVAVFLFTLVGVAVITLVSDILTGSGRQNVLLSDQDQARKLVTQLVNELRNSQSGSDGAYQIESAGDQQFVFFSNPDSQGKVQRIRYYLQNGKMFKGITNYANGGYNTSTEQNLTVQNDVANSQAAPLFYYYDGSYSGTSTQTSLSQPVNVVLVKFVKINLQIYNKAGALRTNYYTVTGGGAIRSLKTNLGQ